eukprot:3267355-Amphidinium_carterae.1
MLHRFGEPSQKLALPISLECSTLGHYAVLLKRLYLCSCVPLVIVPKLIIVTASAPIGGSPITIAIQDFGDGAPWLTMSREDVNPVHFTWGYNQEDWCKHCSLSSFLNDKGCSLLFFRALTFKSLNPARHVASSILKA